MATEKLRIELQALTAKAEKDIRSFEKSVKRTAGSIRALGSSSKTSLRPLGEGLSSASVNANEFEKSMAAANARVIAFGASAGVIYQVQRALRETVKATIEVEKSFADINVVLNTSQQNLQKFGNSLFKIAGQTGQGFKDVSEAATELARQGLSMEKTLSRTKDALILTRLTGMGAVESVESLTAAVNSFSKSGVTSAQVINKMAKVDQAFAVSSEDLAKAISRVGSSAVDAGVSLDELLAITTAVQQRTARGGAVIGNAFKTIFTRIGRTDVQQKLNAIGVATRDMQGNMLGATQVLQNLSDKFKDLSKNQQNQIAESVAGVFQVNILRASLGDLSNKYGVYNKALSDSATASDEAYRKNEQLNKTLDALANKTLANLTKAGAAIGDLALKPAITELLNNVNSVIGSFEEGGKFEEFGQGIGKDLLKGLGRFLSGPGLAMGGIAVGKLLYNFAKFAKQAVGGMFELNSAVANRKNLEGLVSQELMRQPDIINRIEKGETSVAQEARKLLAVYKSQNYQADRLKKSTKAIAASMMLVSGSRGGGRLKKGGKALGFVPNFADENQEKTEAALGGYQAGVIKKMTIPGEGPVMYNSAETVKRFPGMTQPAIMPPKRSSAGKNYRSSFLDSHGFDPYKAQGFIPNFNKKVDKILGENRFEGSLGNKKLRLSEAEKNKISKVADVKGFEFTPKESRPVANPRKLKSLKGRKKKEKTKVYDKITGKGINFVTHEIEGPSNAKMRREQTNIALTGTRNQILSNLPIAGQGSKNSINLDQWFKNRNLYQQRRKNPQLFSSDHYSNNFTTIKGFKDYNKNAVFQSEGYKAMRVQTTSKEGRHRSTTFQKQLDSLVNNLVGEVFERRVEKNFRKQTGFNRREISNDRLDFHAGDIYSDLYRFKSFSGGEAKAGAFDLGGLISKAIGSSHPLSKPNGKVDEIPINGSIALFVPPDGKASGFIPNFATRGTLSSQANPLKLKAAEEANPFINPLDTGKIGYDRHEVFKLNVRNKKGSTKKGGGKINNEYGKLAEEKALPFVKKLGYFPAKDVHGMHNKSSSAVDYIKTSNGLPTGGTLTGVLELKAGDIKTKSMFKPLRSLTENLHLPIVQNMFKKEGPEDLKYESILATKPTARNPYKMTGMMRKGRLGPKGFIPSFSSAISEAIEREKSAGVPSSSIRIGSDSRLSSKANPMGLGVYNTKDEPAGLGQGIDRSIRIGQDPKTHGAAKGFVPNFNVLGLGAKAFTAVAKNSKILTKAVQGLTKIQKKAIAITQKANTLLKEKEGKGGGMGLMGVSMLAQQGVGRGNKYMDAAMEGISWGSSVAMINPLAGAIIGLGMAGYKLLNVTEEQVDMTQAAETALTLLNSAQETASEGFQGITKDLESLGDLKISLPTKDIVDFQNEIYNVFSQAEKNGVTLGAESKAIMSSIEEGKGPTTVRGLKELNTQAQASVAKDTRRQTADFELTKSLNKEGFMRLGAKNQKIGTTFRTEMQGGGYFSQSMPKRVKVDKMGQPIIGVETGGEAGRASSIIRGEVIEKFRSGGEDAEKNFAKAYSGLSSQFQNINNKYSLKSDEELMSDEDYLNDLQKSLSSVLGENIGPEAIKSLLARGKELSSSSDVDDFDSTLDGLQKILKDILSPLTREGGSLDTAGKDFSKVEQDKKETAENKNKIEENRKIFRDKRIDASIAARRDLFNAKNTQDTNADNLNSEKNINLKNAEVEKQMAISDAQSSMNPFGVADASFEAQNNYIRSFEKEERGLLTSKYRDQANVAAASFADTAKANLSKSSFFKGGNNPDLFESQEKEINTFKKLLEKASKEIETNGEVGEKTSIEMEKQRKKSEQIINDESLNETKGSEVRKDINQKMIDSLKEVEGISQGLNKGNNNLNNQVSEMENANEKERKTRKQQLENAEKFNKEERDYQLKLAYIRSNHLALEADNMAGQGRITATEAARRKAAAMNSRRDSQGMKDISKESKDSALIGLEESFGYNQRNYVDDIQSSFREIGDTFKSGISEAIKGMATGATDFKGAMAKIFGSIADKTADAGIKMGVDAMMNAGMKMFQKSSGGPIKKYQTGGLVTGGSGVKDDVLTMMQGGEYVIRKSAVNQIPGGVSTLDSINRSSGGGIPRFAAGGSANVSLKRDFKYTGKDKKRPTGGHFDVDSRMSTLGFFGAQGTKTGMFDRQKKLESYKDYVAAEKKRRADIIARDIAERKGRLMKAYISAAMTIGGDQLSKAMSSSSTGDLPAGYAGPPAPGTEGGTYTPMKSWGPMRDGYVGNLPNTPIGPGGVNTYPGGIGFMEDQSPTWATGGKTSGRVPGMVMGGEYIMSPQTTQQYGSDFMSQLNRGHLPGFAEGGLVGSEKTSSGDEESKAKESSPTTNNVNISINIDKTGKAEPSDSESSSQDQSSEDVTKSKEFSQAIKGVVLEEIVKQQRPGGLLRDNHSKA